MFTPRPYRLPVVLVALLFASGVALPNAVCAQEARKPPSASPRKAPKPAPAPAKAAGESEAPAADEPAAEEPASPANEDHAGTESSEDPLSAPAGDEPAGEEESDAEDLGQAAAGRSTQQIMTDMQAASQELGSVLTSPDSVFEAEQRKANAAKAIPPLKKMLALVDELVKDQPEFAQQARVGQQKWQFLAMLSGFGDKDADARLKTEAGGADKDEAAGAKASQLLSRWIRSDKDAAKQQRIVIDLSALAQASPESDPVTFAAMMMSQAGAATPEIRQSVQKVITDDLKSGAAKQLAQGLRAEQKMREVEGKPLVLKGTTVDGKEFSTADWKGKVILVDFWATWCGPCLAELPRVKKVYADYHDQGFEILGVSCDNEAEDLENFLEQNKDMPWPQLFDRKNKGWHPLATEYGIRGIPTMFLIDKKGVLRSVTARQNFEEMIPQLLKEDGGAAPAAGAGTAPKTGTVPKTGGAAKRGTDPKAGKAGKKPDAKAAE